MYDKQKLSEKFGVEAEEKDSVAEYPTFMKRVKGLGVCLLCDESSINFTADILYSLKKNDNDCTMHVYPTKCVNFNEEAVEEALASARDCDYILAVGSDEMRKIAERAAELSGKKHGLLLTCEPEGVENTSSVSDLLVDCFGVEE